MRRARAASLFLVGGLCILPPSLLAADLVQAYDGEALPADKVARVVLGDPSSLIVLSVDGRGLLWSARRTPGMTRFHRDLHFPVGSGAILELPAGSHDLVLAVPSSPSNPLSAPTAASHGTADEKKLAQLKTLGVPLVTLHVEAAAGSSYKVTASGPSKGKPFAALLADQPPDPTVDVSRFGACWESVTSGSVVERKRASHGGGWAIRILPTGSEGTTEREQEFLCNNMTPCEIVGSFGGVLALKVGRTVRVTTSTCEPSAALYVEIVRD
jgi:hypothetical protein